MIGMLGHCGGVAPGLLPLLIEPPVTRCPTAMGRHDSDVLQLAELVPNRFGPGLVDGIPLISLPPRERKAVAMARDWLAQYRAKGAS